MRYQLFLLLLLLPAAAHAQAGPDAPRPLWTQGDKSVWSVPCGSEIDGDRYCKSLQLRQGRAVLTPRLGYNSVRLLWRQARPGTGPAAIVAGDTGGAAGLVDIFAVTFDGQPRLQQIESRHIARIAVKDGLPELEIGFALTDFNGAPNSQTTIAGLLLRWNGQAFEADLPAMRARRPRITGTATLRAEIREWQKAGPAGGGTPLLAQAMLELTLSGHADRARALLESVWPREPGHKDRVEALWTEFCVGVIAEPAWTGLGLSRLPHAQLVEAAGHRYLSRFSAK